MDTCEPCQAGNRAALSGTIHVPQGRRSRSCIRRSIFIEREGLRMYQALLPQVASQDLCRRGRPGAHHRDLAASGGRGAAVARLPFTGTRGTGKTTCAKILARAVNCEHPENGNPCNRCPSCLGIESGRFLTWWSWTRHRTTAGQRAAARRGDLFPRAGEKRVYIVDEVHMLSTPAFNALLKILEEPPDI